MALLVAVSLSCAAQSVSCGELLEYVESELGYGTTVNAFGSEWIQKVKFYPFEGRYIAVAYIKENEYSWRYRKYIFCGITSYHKSSFTYRTGYNSWGQAFHDYIMPYKCNCY